MNAGVIIGDYIDLSYGMDEYELFYAIIEKTQEEISGTKAEIVAHLLARPDE